MPLTTREFRIFNDLYAGLGPEQLAVFKAGLTPAGQQLAKDASAVKLSIRLLNKGQRYWPTATDLRTKIPMVRPVPELRRSAAIKHLSATKQIIKVTSEDDSRVYGWGVLANDATLRVKAELEEKGSVCVMSLLTIDERKAANGCFITESLTMKNHYLKKHGIETEIKLTGSREDKPYDAFNLCDNCSLAGLRVNLAYINFKDAEHEKS